MDAYRDDKVHLHQKIEMLEAKVAKLSSEKRASLREPTGQAYLQRQRGIALVVAIVFTIVVGGAFGGLAFMTAPHTSVAHSMLADELDGVRRTIEVRAAGEALERPGYLEIPIEGTDIPLWCGIDCMEDDVPEDLQAGDWVVVSGALGVDGQRQRVFRVHQRPTTVLPFIFLGLLLFVVLFVWMGFAAQLGGHAPPEARRDDFDSGNPFMVVLLSLITMGVYQWWWHARLTAKLGRVTGRMDMRALGDLGLAVGTFGIWMFYAYYRNAGALEDAMTRRGKVASLRASVGGLLALGLVVPFAPLLIPLRLQNAYNELVEGLHEDG